MKRVVRCGSICWGLVIAAGAAAQGAAHGPPQLAAYDLGAVDSSADPCQDLYRYACGGWHAANPRPADEGFWSRPFTQYARELQSWIRDRIERASDSRGDASARRVGSYWAACTNDDGGPGRDALEAELTWIGGLRTLEHLPGLLAGLHANLPYEPRAEPLFYLAAVDSPWAGRDEVALLVGPSGLGLPRALYEGDDAEVARRLEAYRGHIERTFDRLGASGQAYWGTAGDVVRFESRLAAARRPSDEKGWKPEDEAGLGWGPFRESMPSFDWDELLRASGIPRVDRVLVRESDFFRSLEDILRDTPLATLRAYLTWTMTNARVEELGAGFAREAFEALGAEVYGVDEAPSRERTCMDALQRDLPDDLGRLFAEEGFEPVTGERARELFDGIRAVVKERIAELDWMAESTRREALVKLDEVRLQIGVPDRWLIDEHLMLRADDFPGNVRRAGASRRRVAFSRIGSPSDGNWWDEPATWVGGYYLRRSNAIVVTAAGLLMTGAVDADLAGLYGNLGTFLAHELMHALDPGGSRYDARGRLRDWWTAADAQHFAGQGRCLADHFSTYEYTDGVPVVGEYVLDEQVAELTAWSVAWTAYRSAVEGRSTQPSAADQSRADRAFFLAAAQNWCSEATAVEWRRRANGGSYKAWASPMVHGTARNVPEFAEVYGCGVEDGMVRRPEDVCRVW